MRGGFTWFPAQPAIYESLHEVFAISAIHSSEKSKGAHTLPSRDGHAHAAVFCGAGFHPAGRFSIGLSQRALCRKRADWKSARIKSCPTIFHRLQIAPCRMWGPRRADGVRFLECITR